MTSRVDVSIASPAQEAGSNEAIVPSPCHTHCHDAKYRHRILFPVRKYGKKERVRYGDETCLGALSQMAAA